MIILPRISWSEEPQITHKITVQQDLEHAISDLHKQRAVLEMASAMVNMLIDRVDRLQDERRQLEKS